MASTSAELKSTILATCKQTRFHIERPDYRELDIEGLNITVTSSNTTNAGKGRSRAKSDGLELLSNAKLRLKAGQRYALVGRNGSGKSSTVLASVA
jgi:ABC-type polysaccharide/polyol phosphate transport system ATPase subunit